MSITPAQPINQQQITTNVPSEFDTQFIITPEDMGIEAKIINGMPISYVNWQLFKGTTPTDKPYYAHIYWNISYNYNIIDNSPNNRKIIIKAKTKIGNKSWVNSQHKQDKQLLRHEYGHYLIGCLCALKFKQRAQKQLNFLLEQQDEKKRQRIRERSRTRSMRMRARSSQKNIKKDCIKETKNYIENNRKKQSNLPQLKIKHHNSDPCESKCPRKLSFNSPSDYAQTINIQKQIYKIFNCTLKEYLKTQEQYDIETNHYYIKEKQKQWEEWIANEINSMKIKTDKAKDRKAKPLIPLMKNRNSCKVIASSKENKSMNLINY